MKMHLELTLYHKLAIAEIYFTLKGKTKAQSTKFKEMPDKRVMRQLVLLFQNAIEALWVSIQDLLQPQAISENRKAAIHFLKNLLEGQVYCLCLYLTLNHIETPFNAFANRADPDQAGLVRAARSGSTLFAYGYLIYMIIH